MKNLAKLLVLLMLFIGFTGCASMKSDNGNHKGQYKNITKKTEKAVKKASKKTKKAVKKTTKKIKKTIN